MGLPHRRRAERRGHGRDLHSALRAETRRPRPLAAGLLGAVFSLAWVIAQLFVVSVSSDAGQRRAIRLGPLLHRLWPAAGRRNRLGDDHALGRRARGRRRGHRAHVAAARVAATSATSDPAVSGRRLPGSRSLSSSPFRSSSFVGTLMAAGGGPVLEAARYVTLGTALLNLAGVLTSGMRRDDSLSRSDTAAAGHSQTASGGLLFAEGWHGWKVPAAGRV